MPHEIILTGGRTTPGVVRIDNLVYRPMHPGSHFVHEVLVFLEQKGISSVPYFRGIDQKNREVITFIDGTAPENLGYFSTEQCCQAVHIMKALHDCLYEFPRCPRGQTVCHNDLSPCNFIFSNDTPIAIIDWDSAAFGDPLDDLAYAVWMWLDIGNDDNNHSTINMRMNAMLDAYGVSSSDRADFGHRILGQMQRVGQSVFPTAEQTRATHLWASRCQLWLQGFLKSLS